MHHLPSANQFTLRGGICAATNTRPYRQSLPADRIPGALCSAGSPSGRLDIVHGSSHHGFDHVACLGRAGCTGVLPRAELRHNTDRKIFCISGCADAHSPG